MSHCWHYRSHMQKSSAFTKALNFCISDYIKLQQAYISNRLKSGGSKEHKCLFPDHTSVSELCTWELCFSLATAQTRTSRRELQTSLSNNGNIVRTPIPPSSLDAVTGTLVAQLNCLYSFQAKCELNGSLWHQATACNRGVTHIYPFS